MKGAGNSGFSLTEMIMVVLIGMIAAGFAVPLLSGSIRQSNADAAAQLIIQELHYARALAVGKHTPVRVQFPSAAEIAVATGTGDVRGPFCFSNGIQLRTTGFGTDTPDGLGGAVLGTGQKTTMYFLDNGSVVDSPANNNLLSGTFYLQHRDGDPDTRRAVTLIGGTGRTRTWRYDESSSSWK